MRARRWSFGGAPPPPPSPASPSRRPRWLPACWPLHPTTAASTSSGCRRPAGVCCVPDDGGLLDGQECCGLSQGWCCTRALPACSKCLVSVSQPAVLSQPAPPYRHPAAAAAKSLLSAVMPGVLEPQRPLATVRLPGKGQAAICAVTHEEADDGSEGAAAERETRLAVATAGGLAGGRGCCDSERLTSLADCASTQHSIFHMLLRRRHSLQLPA